MITTQPYSLWTKKRKIASASSTLALDTLPKSSFSSLRYKLSIFSTIENKNYTSDLLIGKRSSGLVSTLTNKVNFSNLQIVVNDTEDMTNFTLSIVNNESFDLVVEYAKLTLKS